MNSNGVVERVDVFEDALSSFFQIGILMVVGPL